jgi:lipoate-protein ligase A
MSRILKVPDEKFRDKIRKTIEENLTTIQREQAYDKASERWNASKLNALMADEFGKLLGSLDPCAKDDALISKMAALGSQMNTDAWLYRKGRSVRPRSVKIRSGVEVVHRMYKSPGGLIRADFEVNDDRLFRVSISGDFFCYPKDSIARLESMLEGTLTAEIQPTLQQFFSQQDIEIPGVELQDWMKVLTT